MRKRYGWKYGIPAYVAATFVAVSRVESKEHYVQDVLAGATRLYKGWHIQAQVDQKHYGIRLGRTWYES